MGAVDFNLGGLIPDSLFVNDADVAQANADAATATAQIQADAALQASQFSIEKQTELIQTIAIILAIVLLVFAILWFFK